MSTPRTYFLAWALNEKIIPEKILKQPIVNLGIIIGQTLFFGLFNVFVFALLFKYVKRFQTKPKLMAILSFAITLSFFLLYGFLMLNVDKVIPVGLTLITMVLATILCWRFAYKFLVTGVADGGQKYDVFISYSHGK
jgi:CHASE2 domain-containing sensor protein